ncbi:MAG: ATP-binding protein [Candidatus Wolfebacteria bacterium]|nr:ATP-binding protein [Candidatus Wolfebacteria bacterium]
MSPFQASSLTTAILSFALGLFVYLGNRKDKTSQIWAVTVFFVGLWSLGLFGVTFSSTELKALFWQQLLDGAAIFVPIAFLNFVLRLLNIEGKYKRISIFSWIVGLLVLALSFTKYFKVGVAPKLGFNFWIVPGPLYYIFPVTFIIFVSFSLALAIKEFVKTDNVVLKSQLKYVLATQVFGFFGGLTNFFPQFINIYPVGNYFIALYLFFISYAMFKHRLFNIKVLATELIIYAIWMFLLVRIFLAQTFSDRVTDGVLLVMLIIFGILLIRSVFREVEQREKLAIKTQYLTTLRDFSTSIIGTLDFKQTIQIIVNGISERFGYVGALLLLVNEEEHKIYPAAISQKGEISKVHTLLPVPLEKITAPFPENTALSAMSLNTGIVQIDEKLANFFMGVPAEALDKIQEAIGIKTIIAIPIITKGRKVGVLDIFINKPKAEINEEELDILKTMANEIGIVLVNSELFKKVSELSAYKTELMSIVAHQLKNPLVVIKGYSSLVQDGTVKGMKMYKEVFKKIKSSANKLIGTLNNILDLHHIEEGKMHYEFQKLELNKILKEMVDDFQIVANQKNIKLTFNKQADGDVFVNGDPYKLTQVFQNLIDNSLKYTEQGWIKVEAEEKDGSVLVVISDTGRGFTQELGNKLFQKFSRGVEENLILGTGLGLYICKEIVEAHNGKIWAESPGEGKGARFYVSLQAAEKEEKR